MSNEGLDDIEQFYNDDNTVLSFSNMFNQSLRDAIFPDTLHTIIFGKFYSQSLSNVIFPASLKTIIYNDYKIKTSDEGYMCYMEYHCRLSLDKITLSMNLNAIDFDEEFNKCISNINFLPSIQIIFFGMCFNLSLDYTKLPPNLQIIIFGSDFNQSLDRTIFPDSLQFISFGYSFNQSLNKVHLPKSLHTITFGNNFNKPIDNLPCSIETLLFYKVQMNVTNLPFSIRHIKIIENINTSIKKLKIPYGCIIVDEHDRVVEIDDNQDHKTFITDTKFLNATFEDYEEYHNGANEF
ncbi:MAG: hypothetical protein Gaeavirus1_44 [Gaeavirus sp.]|uniref:F-box and FNIP repeat-containing protein n=1 Tax=Gaeavirus sp. TaxID=2487767 RepID=A0A3G4ZYA8_9VIRU|nr:MAG: hypothetical protein Gaeavirus1_44 [Gaeavirus sp.]